ncbi:hypothetical protein J3R83DRAFT_4436 [Lanmaoa asiatica]|nr:hypothetical protein J3R83DRAFT_4436 [Lanmaoa asiatica]
MTSVSYILPPVFGYYVVAALAVTPQTHVLRVVLWPIVTSLALRAAFSVDMSLGEPGRKFHNTMFVVSVSFYTNTIQMGDS